MAGTETREQAVARVIREALSQYAPRTLGRDRAIASSLADNADQVAEALCEAGLA